MWNTRAGAFTLQPGGFRAFIPNPLPPTPALALGDEDLRLISAADRAVARLDDVAGFLLNPDLLSEMYSKREALVSSQIEGTQASLEGLLELEAQVPTRDDPEQVRDVANYSEAIKHGVRRIAGTGITMQLIKELHEILLSGTKGSDKDPGRFRTTQVHIGPPGSNRITAIYVPPPADRVDAAMASLVQYIAAPDDYPALVKAALLHSQFETIHPFRDGNGRIGRLLIMLFLIRREVLSGPVLPLSLYFKKHREDYYLGLSAVRVNGSWEEWVRFFLAAARDASCDAYATAKDIVVLREQMLEKLVESGQRSVHAAPLLRHLFTQPILTTSAAAEKLAVSRQTANTLVARFVDVGILHATSSKRRNRVWEFREYLALLKRGTEQLGIDGTHENPQVEG